MKKLFLCILAFSFISVNLYSQSDPVQVIDQTLKAATNTVTNHDFQFKPEENRGLKSEVFCDDFNVPNTTTIAGWTEQTGDWQILNNQLRTPGGTHQYITVDGSSRVDGILTGQAIYQNPGLQFAALTARYINTSSMILFKLQDNAGSGYWDSYFLYATGVSINGSGNFGMDPIFQLEYVGADLTIRIDVDKDGIWEVVETHSTTHTLEGLCGIAGYGITNLDDYCIDDGLVAPTVPISNWAIIFAILAIGSVVFIRYRKSLV